MKYVVTLNGKKYEVEVEKVGTNEKSTTQGSNTIESPSTVGIASANSSRQAAKPSANGETITAPMPGTILDVKVAVGDKVNAGDVLLILEAMKMENEITAEFAGTVSSLSVAKGNKVSSGDVMVVLE